MMKSIMFLAAALSVLMRIFKVFRQLDSIVAGQVKQKRVGSGGTAGTDAVAFKGRIGNSEMQIRMIFIAPVSLLETLFMSTKRKKQLKYQ